MNSTSRTVSREFREFEMNTILIHADAGFRHIVLQKYFCIRVTNNGMNCVFAEFADG